MGHSDGQHIVFRPLDAAPKLRRVEDPDGYEFEFVGDGSEPSKPPRTKRPWRPERLQQRDTRLIEPQEQEWIFEFSDLGSATPERIERFAARYGPLRLCHHGLPASHIRAHELSLVGPEEAEQHYWAHFGDRLGHREAISDWQRFARQAQAMLQLADLVRSENEVLSEEAQQFAETAWDRLEQVVPDRPEVSLTGQMSNRATPQTVGDWRRVLILAVQTWLDWGNVRVAFVWEDEEPNVEWHADNLFGALAKQLALVIARSDRFAVCTACRVPFATNRKPQAGRDPYCSDPECKRACRARYQRRRRAAEKAARQSAV